MAPADRDAQTDARPHGTPVPHARYSNDGRCSDAYADGTFIHAWLPGIFTDAELREVRGAEVLHITSFTEQDEAEVKALTMGTLLNPRAYRFKKGGQK